MATIGAICDETGEPMEIIGQLRQFTIDPVGLIVTVEDITMEKGEEIPSFSFLTQGLIIRNPDLSRRSGFVVITLN